jgi:subtilisin
VTSVEPVRSYQLTAPAPTSCPLSFCQFLPRGIDRIDGDSSSTKSGDGRGAVPVNVAVLDTGIQTAQPDLYVAGGEDCTNSGSGYEDHEGHGTGVAGVIGARDDASLVVGVAPGAQLWAVKVGPEQRENVNDAQVLCGIDWVIGTRRDADRTNDIAVANMSLGGNAQRGDSVPCGTNGSSAIHEAICSMVRNGVVPVVSAGNEGVDLGDRSPATISEALTATSMADFDGKAGAAGTIEPGSVCAGITGGDMTVWPENTFAFFSNYATSAEDRAHTIAAPGVCIPTTAIPELGGYVFLYNGTSFAAPHVAGVVALCISSGACKGLTVPQIEAKIVSDAAAYSAKHADYGFTGDPQHPAGPGYYGPLVRAAAY